MSHMMAIDKATEPKWHGTALLAVFATLFVWLRWSEVWLNRWVGFVLGLLFLASLFFYLWEQKSIVSEALMPKRVGLLIATGFLVLSAGLAVRFFEGGETGDDAVAAFVFLAFGSGGIYLHWQLPNGKSKSSRQNYHG